MEPIAIIRAAEKSLTGVFAGFEEIAYQNQAKILRAFQHHRVRDSFFGISSGYGYGDVGRDELENIYAEVLGCQDAMVRSPIVSGTHAISACLMTMLRPGQELLSVIGSPYDTLRRVIGQGREEKGTLTERGIIYREVPLDCDGKPDLPAVAAAIGPATRTALIQRSRGYSLRPALCIEDVAQMVETIRSANPDVIIFVDNCYGEFTAVLEPPQVGIDLMAGSLIKNPGGGLASSGGYVAGRSDLVEEVANQLTAPGLGKALGASLTDKRLLFQGLFLAPHIVLQAMKGAALLAFVFEQLGFATYPRWDQKRGDIVQAVQLNGPEQVMRFCQIVQQNSPVDSNVVLEYGTVPGYGDRIIMAAGTFVQGSSIELSCDAPLRPPYVAYFQGGLTYEHCRWVVEHLIAGIMEKGIR